MVIFLTHLVAFLTVGTVLGLVFRATEEASESSAQYAIKLERASKKRQRPPSEHEANVLKILADANVSPRIPRVIDYGYDKPSHSKALVLDLLGVDLQSIRKQCGGRFSIKTTLMLATRLVCVPDFCSISL
jgi:predicted Ser/Thr protein kinase